MTDKNVKLGKDIIDEARNQLRDRSPKISTDKEIIDEFVKLSKTIIKKSGLDLIDQDKVIEGETLSINSVWINQLKELVKKIEQKS